MLKYLKLIRNMDGENNKRIPALACWEIGIIGAVFTRNI